MDLELGNIQLDYQPTGFERALGTVLPGIADRIYTSRMTWQAKRAYYDAAQKNRLTSSWRSVSADPNRIWTSDAATLRDRARHAVGSNPHACAAIQALVDAVIGEGIDSQCQIIYSPDATVREAQRTLVDEAKREWFEYAGLHGEHYQEIAQLQLRTEAVAGESFTRLLLRPDGDRIPLRLQAIDPARLTSLRADVAAGNQIFSGIEINGDGDVVAYHVASGDYRHRVERIPAHEMVHTYRREWPGQLRGISWLSASLPDLAELNEIKHYAVVARKIQASMAVILTRPMGSAKPPMFPGAATPSGETKTDTDGNRKMFVKPGGIIDAGEGTATAFTPHGTEDLSPLSKLLLRSAGVGFGIPYEWISGDYQGVTFASGRLSILQNRKRIRCVHAHHRRTMHLPIHTAWMDAAVSFTNRVPRVPRNVNPYAVRFSRPVFGWGINPLQEVNAAARAIEVGLSSHNIEIEQMGRDWRDVFKQVVEEGKWLDNNDVQLPRLRGDASEEDDVRARIAQLEEENEVLRETMESYQTGVA